MLIGAKLEFRVVKNVKDYVTEGALIEDNEDYRCVADAFTYYVAFKKLLPNQILIIEPDELENLDPDGGCTFMQRNVKQLIECLFTTATYL